VLTSGQCTDSSEDASGVCWCDKNMEEKNDGKLYWKSNFCFFPGFARAPKMTKMTIIS